MSLPWGVKEFVEPDQAEAFGDYVKGLVETEITLPSENIASVLKADVKVKKDKCLLIMRYELTKQA